MLNAATYFEGVKADLPGDGAARAAALAAAESDGLPTRRQETWHYTDVAQLLKRGNDDAVVMPDFASTNGISVDFADGKISNAPTADGLTLAAFCPDSAVGPDAVTNYNTAFARDGLHARIDKTLKQPLVVTTRGSAVQHLAHKIHIAAGADAVIVDNNIATGYTNARFDIEVEADAKLTLIRVQQAGHQIGTNRVTLAARAQYKSVAVVTGGTLARHEAQIALTAQGAHAELHSAVFGHGQNHADFTYVIDHEAADTNSMTSAYNVLDGAARGVFQGKVIVRPDAQHVDAQMQTRAMMLSDGAEMDAKPELEIYADDVACAHGSAIGELDRDALFFLRARGLDEASARQLLVTGFIEQVLGHIDDSALADSMRDLIQQKITGQFALAEQGETA